MHFLYIWFLLLATHSTYCACPVHTASDGTTYELSSLTRTDGDYTYTDNSLVYIVNICAAVSGQCFGKTDQAVCKVDALTGGEWASGTASSIQIRDHPGGPSKGVQVWYGEGEVCTGQPRSTTINIDCNPTSNGEIYSIIEDTSCTFIIAMRSLAACGSGGRKHNGGSGMSAGWVIDIILLATTSAYLLGGCAYKYLKQGATGIEVIPNIEFWKGLPMLVKDGVLYVTGKITGQTGYSSL